MIQLVPLFRGPQPSGRGPVLVPWHVRNWTAQQEVSGSEGRESELVKLRLLLLITGITSWTTPPTSPWKNCLLVRCAQKVGDCCPCWSIPRIAPQTLLERWRTWGSYQNAELNGSWMGPVVLLPWLAPRWYWCSGHTLSSKAQGNCFLSFLSALPVK